MLGQAVNLLGDWMQQTAQAWVVWELTHKATALGIVAFLSQIPFFIFGPWVGIIADRFDSGDYNLFYFVPVLQWM